MITVMMVVLFRREPDSTTRYETLHDRQGNLFGFPTLTVTAGRDFSVVRERHHTFESLDELDADLKRRIDRRRADGYRVLYAWVRGTEARSIGRYLASLDAASDDPRLTAPADPRSVQR